MATLRRSGVALPAIGAKAGSRGDGCATAAAAVGLASMESTMSKLHADSLRYAELVSTPRGQEAVPLALSRAMVDSKKPFGDGQSPPLAREHGGREGVRLQPLKDKPTSEPPPPGPPPASRGQPAPLQGDAHAAEREPWPDQASAKKLSDIAASLSDIARSLAAGDAQIAATLNAHAASITAMLPAPSSLLPEIPRPGTGSHCPGGSPSGVYCRRKTSKTQPRLDHREAATGMVQDTGLPGNLLEDLTEVSLDDIKDEHAISYWRSCRGIRVYRSETATRALRMICSAQVPGLNGPSYLDVFDALTKSARTHHIFLFGGLVRDILRRKVGNDIDIAFSAPAAELQQICHQHGYRCDLQGDYILIGDETGAEYLEGMVITHNGIQPAYHADFSMNWLFYDFCNDVIVDKEGDAVTSVIANTCEIPCPKELWPNWIEINGSRVLFRYYKFLLRGYSYTDTSMGYVGCKLLEFWSKDPEETIAIGREALGNAVVSSSNVKQMGLLRELVSKSFDLAMQRDGCRSRAPKKRHTITMDGELSVSGVEGIDMFFSSSQWWNRGWHILLKLPAVSDS